MTTLLLSILGEGLKAWNTERGRSLYNDYKKHIEVYNEEMDRRSKTGKHSQLAVDRSLRELKQIAEAYYKFITTDPTVH